MNARSPFVPASLPNRLPNPFSGRSAILPLLLALAAGPVQGEATRYISDRIEINLRAGESWRYKILKTLSSGTPVEVLSVNETTKYARVRTPDGTTGFVLMRELQDEPVARERLAELETRLAELEEDPDSLSTQLARLRAEHAELEARYRDLERERAQREQELAAIRHASANVVEVAEDRERLRIEVAELTRVRADLAQENRDLRNQENQSWFLIGAGVLGGGILLGILLPRLRLGRRKSSWGTL